MSQEDRTVEEQLEADRAATAARLQALRGSKADLVTATADANSDDEHDPEGTTIGFERAQLQALLVWNQEHLAEVEAARARLTAGTYGRCEECGEQIAPARLAARPTATRCIGCTGRR